MLSSSPVNSTSSLKSKRCAILTLHLPAPPYNSLYKSSYPHPGFTAADYSDAQGATQYEKFQAESLAKAATAEPDFSDYAQKEQWDQKQAHAESGGVGAWGYYSDNFKEARVANETQYVNYKDQ